MNKLHFSTTSIHKLIGNQKSQRILLKHCAVQVYLFLEALPLIMLQHLEISIKTIFLSGWMLTVLTLFHSAFGQDTVAPAGTLCQILKP